MCSRERHERWNKLPSRIPHFEAIRFSKISPYGKNPRNKFFLCELTYCPQLTNFDGFLFSILAPIVIYSTLTVAFPCMNRSLCFIANHSNFCLKNGTSFLLIMFRNVGCIIYLQLYLLTFSLLIFFWLSLFRPSFARDIIQYDAELLLGRASFIFLYLIQSMYKEIYARIFYIKLF